MMVGRNIGSTETAKRIPKDSVGVEIGVWRGDTTEKFIKNAKEIVAVDPWSVEGMKIPIFYSIDIKMLWERKQ